MTLFEAYVYLKPPIELIEHLERYEANGQLPAPVLAWLDMWRKIRNDYTGAIDCVAIEQPAMADVGELDRVLA